MPEFQLVLQWSRMALALTVLTASAASWAGDSDSDGVSDTTDNCTLIANVSQLDTNGDGIGNRCDADFNNNGIVDSQDGALLKAAFGSAAFPDRDLNGNGIVDSQDGALLKSWFGKAPGPYAAATGLNSRPSNTTCIAPLRPDGNATVATVDAFPTAPALSQPVKILQAPGDPSRWFVLEKTGRVKVFSASNPAVVTTWLDFSTRVNDSGEGGLLGMAFHPSYPTVPQVFVSYTGDPASAMVSKVSRVILNNVTTPTVTTEQILLTVNQPFNNHNGGDIAFGADGSLYLGLGDGGDANDPFGYAQNNTRLLGKMLRINVVGVTYPLPGYLIPADNPFAASPKCGPAANAGSCPEIYASGLRNPFRWSFDRPTGDLWAGDVGQGNREEVNRIEKGGNYGWNCREGFLPGPGACAVSGLKEPVSDYPHVNGDVSITGGYVYRGTAIPSLQGRYVFADYGSGRIWALENDGQGGYSNDQLIDTPYNITTFGLGEDGELYFADIFAGRIHRLMPAAGGTPDTIPASLAATGCVAAGSPTQPGAGVIPFGVNAQFWADNAGKERYLAVPNGTTVTLTAGGDFDFPARSVLMKSMRLAGQLIETRLLMRHPDGVWAGYTYEWNAAQTAATRVVGGKTRQVSGQTWIYPSEGQCMQCHTAAAGFALGAETAQLNSHLTYPATNRTSNQLATLAAIGLFSAPLPGPPGSLPALADPTDTTQTLNLRARAWLHTNCAQCHQPGGPTPSSMDLRYSTPLAATLVCNVVPQSGSLGITDARLVAPGDAARSVVLARANRRDALGMPPVASSLVDTAGVSLLTAWINSLSGC